MFSKRLVEFFGNNAWLFAAAGKVISKERVILGERKRKPRLPAGCPQHRLSQSNARTTVLLTGLRARVLQEKSQHLVTGIWPARISVAARLTATAPRVRRALH